MADLSISQIIQESLVNEQITDEHGNPVSTSRFDRATRGIRNAASKGSAWVKNHPYKTGAAAAGAAGLAAGAYAGKRYLDNRARAGRMKTAGKIAAGSLAAIGAGVGAKALLNYLKKKKKNG